ncbi:hypothetical protein [Amycolatopsis sp. NPDC059657]|uniref:hypothetical protein n=1 Tax=Amycolatopsis sp. NPDC059657 TaxID=3346899 RepID=UPI00366F2A56
MVADYILECGHWEELPATDEMLSTDPKTVDGYVWCTECKDWRLVIERADPADVEVAS